MVVGLDGPLGLHVSRLVEGNGELEPAQTRHPRTEEIRVRASPHKQITAETCARVEVYFRG